MLLITLLIVGSVWSSVVQAAGYPSAESPPDNAYLPISEGGNGGGDGGGGDFAPSGPPIPIIRMMAKLNLDGSYNYEYETGNGITVQESSFIKSESPDGNHVRTASGFFSYTSPEGQPISVNYVADENGFQPQGDHLPTPPPIPEAIQELLDQIAAGGGCDGSDDNTGANPSPPAAEPPSNGGYVY